MWNSTGQDLGRVCYTFCSNFSVCPSVTKLSSRYWLSHTEPLIASDPCIYKIASSPVSHSDNFTHLSRGFWRCHPENGQDQHVCACAFSVVAIILWNSLPGKVGYFAKYVKHSCSEDPFYKGNKDKSYQEIALSFYLCITMFALLNIPYLEFLLGSDYMFLSNFCNSGIIT